LKLTAPEPVTDPQMAAGLPLPLVLHVPLFVKGPTKAAVSVRVSEPVIPAYAFVPLTIGTGALATIEPEQLTAL
jgi:hypothetical protein